MEVVSDCAIGDVLIDKEQLAACASSAAIEADKAAVVEARQDVHLIHKLLVSFVAVLVKTLHSNYTSIS